MLNPRRQSRLHNTEGLAPHKTEQALGMIRQRPLEHAPPPNPTAFCWRGGDVSRLEGFSDADFAFAPSSSRTPRFGTHCAVRTSRSASLRGYRIRRAVNSNPVTPLALAEPRWSAPYKGSVRSCA